jgi:hypothetical protein
VDIGRTSTSLEEVGICDWQSQLFIVHVEKAVIFTSVHDLLGKTGPPD